MPHFGKRTLRSSTRTAAVAFLQPDSFTPASDCGRFTRSSPVPISVMRPVSTTAMRSQKRSASSMSWLTYSTVPWNASNRLTRFCSSTLFKCASSAENGSSSMRMPGRAASMRASATRCCWPPDN